MKSQKQFFIIFLLFILFAIGLALRLLFLPANTIDMKVFNLKWYDYIVSHGIVNALGDEFANYTPPYLYLLSIATLTKSFLPKLTAIKLIPITFDLVNTFLVYQIIKVKFSDGFKPALGAVLFWVLPTVMINGSFWGQADALYTCFLLLCILFLLRDRSIEAVIAFAIAFSIKAQAVFMLPFLAILFFRKRIPWQTFLLIPPVYILMMLPSILAGRSIASLLLIYVSQGETFESASMNAANFYFFVQNSGYETAVLIGIPLAALLLLTWALIYGRKKIFFNRNIFMLTALISVALVPFLLPKMHDRYFYPADVFSLLTAFFMPELWFVAIAYQVVSSFSYAPFLFGGNNLQSVMPIAIALNTFTIGFLLRKQWKLSAIKSKTEAQN